jgi:uncharacterized protein (TIGR03790 family)
LWLVSLLLAALVGSFARPAEAQTGHNVLVVANSDSPASLEIAEYYARRRHIAPEQIIRLQLPVTEEIQRPLYLSKLERPIASWLTAHAAQDRILYVVLTKDVPLRIAGSGGLDGTVASVDSELTLLYRKLSGSPVVIAGSVKNPYFLADAPISEAQRFTHQQQDIYLVARLDGFTIEDVKALIDRGGAQATQGLILLDERSEWRNSPGNTWLEKAAANLKGIGGWHDRVVLDAGARVLRDQANVLGYYSWGSNDPAIIVRHLHLQFVPGALAATFVSTDGRTFREPPAEWQVRGESFEGSNQSLIGDFIRDGVTGVAGHVAEPYLNGTIRPDILFPAYVSGFNLVESFYLAMPFVSWQTIVVGDPLCAPYRQKPLAANEIDPGLDNTTELPTYMSERLVAALTAKGAKPQAARLYIKADFRLAKQDRAAARQALEEATSLDDTLVAAHLLLATLYERAAQWDAAIERYRRVIARDPDQPVALNNLAFALAVHGKAPADALPIAKRAYIAAKGAPSVADTLGWVYHLLGNDVEAEPFVVSAADGEPSNAELQIHSATVLAANGKAEPAARALDRAIALDKTLEQRADVRELRARLHTPKGADRVPDQLAQRKYAGVAVRRRKVGAIDPLPGGTGATPMFLASGSTSNPFIYSQLAPDVNGIRPRSELERIWQRACSALVP